jgi:hypothetical protein
MFLRRLLAILLVFALASTVRAQTFVDADADEDFPAEDIFDDGGGWDDGFVPDGDLDQYETYAEPGQEEAEAASKNDRVKGFDVAGVMLGFDLQRTKEVLRERRYRLKDIEYRIPEFFAYNYDSICREKSLLIPATLKSCIEGLARKDKMRYVASVKFARADTGEKVEVYFTSPVTGSKVWKVVYANDVNRTLGEAKNFQYQRDERRRAFWYSIKLKYGEPNVEPNHWLLDTMAEHPTGLRAEFGRLTLENPQQNAFDYSEGWREAQRQFKYKEYSF